MKPSATTGTGPDLRVDWTACRGRGLCHEVAPELIALDPWGYPLFVDPAPDGTLDQARDAVTVCPMQALRVVAR